MANYITEGIVIHKTNYSETSLVLKVLTANKGIKSFIFKGAKRKHKNGQLVSPLSILNITYYQRNDSDLAKISAVELQVIYKNIPFNPIKAAVVFFLNEIILKTIKEEEKNSQLYEFIKSAIQVLDVIKSESHFPLLFLSKLLQHLGYSPLINKQATYFDYLNGKFSNNEPNHPNYMHGKNVQYLNQIFKSNLTTETLNIPAKNRQQILVGLLDYYKAVLGDFKTLKSLDVLEAILH